MKYFIIFAVPNGSGKSSLRSSFEKTPPPFFDFLSTLEGVRMINADFFARTDPRVSSMSPGPEKDREAWTLTEEARNQSLKMGENIIWETVFSDRRRLDEIAKAHHSGYYVPVIYVTTLNPYINLERVANRVKNGGHDVPSEKVISRYKHSTALLPEIVLAADEILVYDNSSEYPVLTFFKANDRKLTSTFEFNQKTDCYYLPRSKIGENRYNWVNEHLIKPLTIRGCAIKQAHDESNCD